MRPRDHAARHRAVTETSVNVVVSAGAGTGKTSLIVERLLVTIGGGRAPLHAIAAITFTEKAAGELRVRLAEGLEELAGGAARAGSAAERALAHLDGEGVPRARTAARAREAATYLDRATVTTIHGFCAEILRSHPIEAELPPGFQVDRGPASALAAREEWERFLEDELGPGATREEIWRQALSALSASQLETLGRDLARGEVPAAVLAAPYQPVDFAATLGSLASRLASDLLAARDATGGLTNAPRSWIDEAIAVLDRAGRGDASGARRVLAASQRVPDPMPSVRTAKVSSDEARRLEALAGMATPLLRAIERIDEPAAAAALETVLPYARALRERLLRAGLVDFDTLLVAARDLLRDHPDVRETLKGRFAAILLDEFQDTDPLQYEIVFYLAERAGDAADDPWAARLTPGRLFIVGDAKQSIYRFRGADYDAYRRAVARVIDEGGVELTLSANFRSVPGVLGPINAIGSGWAPSRYLPPYEPIAAEREGGSDPVVEIWTTPHGASAVDARRRAEGKAIAAEIRAIAAGGTPYRDVLILLRGFTDVPLYLRELREAGVPFVVSGGKTFYERTEIVQALGVLRAVADPADPIARLAYLRSPAGGVPDAELARAAQGGPHPVATPTLWAADLRLAALRAEVATLPVDLIARHVLERSGLLALGGAGFEGAQRVANLEKLASDASEFARDGRLTLTELLDALDDRPRGEEEGDSPLADETTDAVRVMTVHKAKGLEAPVVILADAAAGRNFGGAREWRIGILRADGQERILLQGPKLTNTACAVKGLEDRYHQEAEDQRLLYVALTRARERLIVFAGAPQARSPWMDALAAWGYDARRPPADGTLLLGGSVRARTIDPPESRAPVASGVPEGAPLAVDAYARAALAGTTGGELRSPSAEAPAPAVGMSPIDPGLARAVGIAVHERLAGLPSSLLDPAVAAEAGSILESFEGSPLKKRLASMEILAREIPILLHDAAGTVWRGSIDLLARDPDGSIVVVDYKTDAEAEGAIERHRAQLQVYAESVRRSLPGCPVRAELWMLRHGTFFEAVRL